MSSRSGVLKSMVLLGGMGEAGQLQEKEGSPPPPPHSLSSSPFSIIPLSLLCSPLKCHSSDLAFGLISLVQTNRHPPGYYLFRRAQPCQASLAR